MKLDKKILICALLALMVLICINGVSAQDTIDKNLTTSDTQGGAIGDIDSPDTLEVSDSVEKLGGNTLTVGEGETYTTIASAVSAASSGDTIYIKNGNYQEGKFTSFTKSLTFEGQSKEHVIIDYTTSQSFLTTSSDIEITVKNMQFKGLNSGNNALFQFTSATNKFTIDNCIIDDCGSKNLLNLGKATVLLKDTQFLNCRATATAGAFITTAGGSITMTNCLFNNSRYTGASGQSNAIIYCNSADSIVIINGGTTISNCQGNSMSIIRNNGGTVTVSDSRIVDNAITHASSSIFYNTGSSSNINAMMTVTNTVISGNTNVNLIYQNDYTKSTSVQYCNIQGNTITNMVSSGSATITKNYWGTNEASEIPSGAFPYVIFESDSYKLSDNSESNIPIPSLTEEPSTSFTVYVDPVNGDNSKDGSSEDNAVKDISTAVSKANNGKIILLAGTHTVASTISIDKDLDIHGKGAVIISAATQVFNNPDKELNLTNIKFTSTATGDGAVISSNGKLNIEKCIIEATTTASSINIGAGEANIANSVLLNSNGQSLAKSSGATVNANNNWWGVNSTPNTIAQNWIVMNATLVSNSKIGAGDEISVVVSFEKLNDGSAYQGKLPDFEIPLTSTSTDLASQTLTISNNKKTVTYTANNDNTITVSSGSTTITLPVKIYVAPDVMYVATNGNDDNDGDEAHPLKTIGQAIALAQHGKIVVKSGTYAIDATLVVDKDLEITGEGNVVIDGGSQCRLMTVNSGVTASVNNIKFANGHDSASSANAISNSGILTLNNVEVYNNVHIAGFTATTIRNNNQLTVNNSKFHNNIARHGTFYNNGGKLIINGSEFYNNDMSEAETVNTGLAIYSVAGNVNVDNSQFHDNIGNFSTIYFKSSEYASYSTVYNLNVNNCTFNKNQYYGFGAIYSENANTDIKDTIFTNNNVQDSSSATGGQGAAIYVSGEKTTVETSVFMNNKAKNEGKDIYVYKGELAISDSVIINSDYSLAVNDGNSPVITVDNNWWGKNTPNTKVPVSKWIRMDVSCNDSEIYRGDTIRLDTAFNLVDTSGAVSQYDGDLKFNYISVTIISNGGLNVNLPVVDKKSGYTYTVNSEDKDIYVISSNAISVYVVKGEADTIYVSTSGDDKNTGDLNNPVATLEKAIEIAQKGKIIVMEGTYKTPYLGIISKNLTITGEGNVVIDADNNNRILYVGNESTVVLNNLVLTNGYTSEASDESGALLGNSGNLTINKCILSNSKSEKNAGAIYNAANLTVIDSQFINNVADKVGGAIFTQYSGIDVTPILTITGSTFTNNTAKGNKNYAGGAVYAQGAEFVTITDSVFDSNKAIEFGGGAVEITVTAKATIDNCKFINNTANGEAYDQKSDYGGGAVSFIGSYADLAETLTVTNTLFEDNSVSNNGGGAIYTRYAKVNVSGSALINNNDAANVEIYRRTTDINTAVITANDNWWGSNYDPKSKINGGTITSWATLTVSNSTPITQAANVKLTASLKSGNDTSISIERPVLIHTNLGDIKGVLANGEFSTNYNVPSGLKIISATVDSETQILYFVTTDITVVAEDLTCQMGDRLQYTVKVNSIDGSVVDTGSVEVYFGDDLVATIAVSNSTATGTVVINKETGIYGITVKYTDKTKEFADNQTVKTLNVTGINNVLTPETLINFFDGNGVLYSDVPFDELIVEGTYSNLGVLTINKTIKISGNAKFENTAFKILADNVELSNLQITLNKTYADNDGAAIYIGADNAVLNNNKIVYDAEDNVQSYVISVDVCENTKITGNDIKYTAKSEGDVETIAVKVVDSDGLVFNDNILDANIPSVPIGYAHWPKVDYLSQALHVEASDNTSIKNNVIDVKYTNAQGSYDTIYAVHVTDSDNVNVTDNQISLDAHDSGYGLVMDGENLLISNNDIDVVSQDYYATGININSASIAVIDGNNISASSKQVSYPVYLDDWGMDGEVNITNNNIEGDSNTVYGVAVQETKSVIAGNDIKVSGNYTMGVQSYQTDLTATGNTIVSNGSNVGTALSPQGSVPVITTGICAKGGNINIADNNIVSTGKTAIDVNQTTGTIENNSLVSAAGKGDASVNKENSTVTGDNNKASYDIKLTAQDIKMDYKDRTAYKVLVTDGDVPLTGVTVSIKINSATYEATTGNDGYAKLNINLVPKTYFVTAQYMGQSVKSKLVIKQILKSKNVSVKKSAKKLVLKATLKKSNGKAIKKAKVTFKFKGKTYTAKTNSKGIAKVTIKKNVIKKLKAGKSYKVKITYFGDSIKKSVKVKK